MKKIKDQLKRKLLSLAFDIGPNIEDVKQVILHMIANKKVVGYHLIMKLTDLGLINYYIMPKDIISLKFASISVDDSQKIKKNDTDLKGFYFENLFDTAKIFNKDIK